MVRVYWYSLAIIYLACAVMGAALFYQFWGVGGGILGAVMGGMVASGVAIVLNTPERMEAAIYTVMALLILTLLIWLIISFWGVRL
jgi:fructose-specific phosphotransferase system IIC component